MSYQTLFDRLWLDYCSRNPKAKSIYQCLINEGEQVINDHIALRTFDDSRVNIEVLAQPFLDAGYTECGDYQFEAKKLYAKHFEHQTDSSAPKVFISQLKTGEFSQALQQHVKTAIDQIPTEQLKPESLLFSQRPWPAITYAQYQSTLKESEYAAWLLAYGYCANHFTVNINALKKYNDINVLNQFLIDQGYALNTSGGMVKGSKEQLLEQSSTLAEVHPLKFADGTFEVPACYYEFAKRYSMANGKLYTGFVAASADKIFESTDVSS